jgi:hypothetical protein
MTQRGNVDLWLIAQALALVLTLVVEGLAVGRTFPLLAVTQYLSTACTVAIVVIEVGNASPTVGPNDGRLPFSRRRVVWLVVWVVVVAASVALHPTPWFAGTASALAWLYVFSEFKCRLGSDEEPGLRRRVRRVLAAVKRAIGVGSGTLALVVAGVMAVCCTTGTVVASIRPAEASTKGGNTTPNDPGGGSKSPGKPPAPSNHGSPPSGQSGASTGSLDCARHSYPEANWASSPINAILNGGTVLGPEETGCIGKLITTYLATGFVYGIGVSSVSRRPVSIVVDDERYGHPGVFIAPTLIEIETIIARYHLVMGTEREFPRFSAGAGDFYLANVQPWSAVSEGESSGTCVLIRKKSGNEAETLPYELLYPAVSVAWERIIEVTKRWQWPVVDAFFNRDGEEVINLFRPGADTPDATITAKPQGGEAHWKEYGKDFRYLAREHYLNAAELEDLVNKYLPESEQD